MLFSVINMSKSDVEMEDDEKLPHNSGKHLQESENKAINANIEDEEDKLTHVDAVSEDTTNKRENGGEDMNTSSNEDKGNPEVEDETNPKCGSNESIEKSILEESSVKAENEKPVNIKNVDEDKSARKSAIEEHMDIENEALQQDITIGAEKEQKSSDNSLDGEIKLKDVAEKSIDDVEEKRPKEVDKDADCVKDVAQDKTTIETVNTLSDTNQNRQLPTELSTNKASQAQNIATDAVPEDEIEGMDDSANLKEDKSVKDHMEKQGGGIVLGSHGKQENAMTVETAMNHDRDSLIGNQQEPATPTSIVRDTSLKMEDYSGETVKSVFTLATLPPAGENDDGTPEEQAAFMKEIESFYRRRTMDFKPPKFYGQPLNCLKLWRAVIRLGGYDRVTGSKLWRQVGESFHPPKTCTTVSWTFRIFYEKSLLEYERHKTQSGELQLPVATLSEAPGADVEGNGYQGSGPGRARRDAAARAMQGWHAQRLSDYGEVGEPIIKDKNSNNVTKRERNLKNIGSVKQKRPSEAEHSNKAARTEISKQLVTPIIDVGPPADWVKINVRQTKDCFEIYALVPGLLREEVRVQSDPAGRVVITGQPEQVENPWGITPFRKVVSLPGRIDPLQTSAMVSLHGRLLIRVPFESSNI